MLATVVFVISGSQVLPLVFAGSSNLGPLLPGQSAAFLLNIALLLFAWRRSAQLKQTFAERDAAEQRTRDLAYIDEVTGLFNRRYIKQRFAAHHAQTETKSVLLLLDLDNFKHVNDLYGHEVGDDLLLVCADRIRRTCPEEAICVRLGGDEFAILLLDMSEHSGGSDSIATRLIAELGNPFHLANSRISVGVSVGIAGSERDNAELGALMRRADIAMYEAKRLGGNRTVAFDASMEAELARRTALETDLRRGIASGEFIPYFQPIIDLESRETRGFEVLARWNHPTRGILEPPEFLEIAESSGLIGDLSLAVMQDALTTAAKWPSRYRISVNVSPVQFRDHQLAQRIFKLLDTPPEISARSSCWWSAGFLLAGSTWRSRRAA